MFIRETVRNIVLIIVLRTVLIKKCINFIELSLKIYKVIRNSWWNEVKEILWLEIR